ncbi:MAG: LD-carboxypeptidase [Candidatus Azobacteroides sp.]|nr:LD-carboxypeptidase [Candidatus Azobacteroides sp.]
MKMNNPPFLKPGDQVAIVSPSGKINPDYIAGEMKRLQDFGLIPVPGKYVSGTYGRYAGTDAERLFDLQEALDNPGIKAVFCSRGGYGCIHLADKLQWNKFRRHPKWMIGYSDITIIHSMVQHLGFTSLHAPMARHLTEMPEDDISVRYLRKILFGERIRYRHLSHDLNRNGKTTGVLRGGNLSVLYGLRGTRFDLIPGNTVLFLEDTGEKPYHVERMMYNLKLGGILEKLSGLIIGQFSDYEEDPEMPKPLFKTIADMVSEYAYPVCFGFPVGHVTYNLPMICGGMHDFEVSEQGVDLKVASPG